MTLLDTRLVNHQLLRSRSRDPVEVVSWLCAVQAQDFPGARWALGLRTTGATEAHVERAFNAGSILRTHVLRPTWHFVTSHDIRWVIALTGARVIGRMASRHRQLELDRRTQARGLAAFARALEGGTFLTRAELTAVLRRARIHTTPERVGHLLMVAELEGVLCSGPLRDREFTYALLDERVPASAAIGRDEALARLAQRYFASHGPATLADFAWWSGLPLRDARVAAELATPAERHGVPPRHRRPLAWLLPAFDEYLVAYKERGAVLWPHAVEPRDALGPTVVVDGRAVGAWRRTLGRHGVAVEIAPRRRFTPGERLAIQRAARRYEAFLERPVTLSLPS